MKSSKKKVEQTKLRTKAEKRLYAKLYTVFRQMEERSADLAMFLADYK